MIELVKHSCNNCGPKEACLFPPNELKKKTSYCIKCVAQRRKARVCPNPYPAAAEGYQFDRWGGATR
jgi:hypothetical protein